MVLLPTTKKWWLVQKPYKTGLDYKKHILALGLNFQNPAPFTHYRNGRLPAPLNFEQKIFFNAKWTVVYVLSFISSGIILRKKIVRGKKKKSLHRLLFCAHFFLCLTLKQNESAYGNHHEKPPLILHSTMNCFFPHIVCCYIWFFTNTKSKKIFLCMLCSD